MPIRNEAHSRIGRILFAVLLGVVLFWGGAERMAYAGLPYETFAGDTNKEWIKAPHAFVPQGVWSGFNRPEDLFITSRDELYVVDTGNDRVVQYDTQGNIIRILPQDAGEEEDPKAKLRKPEGIFVTEEGMIYVADTGNRRVAVFDADGQYARELRAPDSELLPRTFVYAPLKVIVDQRGYIYIVTKGGYQGLLQLAPDGTFSGFFGANKVPVSWLDSLKRRFFTEEQLQAELSKLPGAVTNVAVDSKGFIYTANKDLKSGQLKRLNFGGIDLLQGYNFAPWIKPLERFSFQDVHIDGNGVMSAIESAGGKVYQYDKYGELLFQFGSIAVGGEQRLGMFKRMTSIVADSAGTLYIADGELNRIQVMKRTQYGELVHQAAMLDNQGKYKEAGELWATIHQMNGMFDRAYLGMGKAMFKVGDYEEAMVNFAQANDRSGYSESFWQVRMDFLMRYFGSAMTALIALAVSALIYRRFRRKGQQVAAARQPWQPQGPLRQIGLILRDPMNGMYEAAAADKVRWGFALLFVLGGFVLIIAGKAAASMLFASQSFASLNLGMEAMKYFLPWISWVVANYLTGSVMRGEGSFGRVLVVSSYALAPYVLFILPIQLLSNVLTLQEAIFYSAATTLIVLWMLVLIFIGTQQVHNYNFKEALGMTAVTVVTFICIWVFGFVLIGLLYQAVDFVYGFVREVWLRVQ